MSADQTLKVAISSSPLMGGRCLVATSRIEADEVIGEYRGRMLPDVGETAATAMIGYLTIFGWADGVLIDPEDVEFHCVLCYGNYSHKPNAELRQDNKFAMPYLVALKAIPKGKELTYDYSLDLPPVPYLRKKWKCLCGESNCTGDMLMYSTDSEAQWERDYKELVARAEYFVELMLTHGPRNDLQRRVFAMLKKDDLEWLTQPKLKRGLLAAAKADERAARAAKVRAV